MNEKFIMFLIFGFSMPLTANATGESAARSTDEHEIAPVYVNRYIDAGIDGAWENILDRLEYRYEHRTAGLGQCAGSFVVSRLFCSVIQG